MPAERPGQFIIVLPRPATEHRDAPAAVSHPDAALTVTRHRHRLVLAHPVQVRELGPMSRSVAAPTPRLRHDHQRVIRDRLLVRDPRQVDPPQLLPPRRGHHRSEPEDVGEVARVEDRVRAVDPHEVAVDVLEIDEVGAPID